ncbi:hypothetical protein [Saccharicrinis sp. 156]|uniref:hypothetical protein n=1 Tax=Saccharicrinis sp. 156 TaxID=3417574 RepID=UPI003D347959
MRKNIGFIVFVVISVLYVGITLFRNKTEFPVLFEEYDYTFCLTTGKGYGHQHLSTSVVYEYRVNGEVFKGISAVDNVSELKIPGGKYLIVYSKKDPAYHVFFKREVTVANLKGIKVSREELKKKFDVNSKAKKKNRRKKNKEKVPSVEVPDLTVSPN